MADEQRRRPFSFEEYADILFYYGDPRGNAEEARQHSLSRISNTVSLAGGTRLLPGDCGERKPIRNECKLISNIVVVINRPEQSCVNLTVNEINFLTDGKERWSCPACCKQGRVTRSGSTSSTCGARSETTAPLQPDQSASTDTLTLILNQLSTKACDIKDIKNSQSQLRTDVAYCRNSLQQHSDSISRHEDLIADCETNIQNIQKLLGTSVAALNNRGKDPKRLRHNRSANLKFNTYRKVAGVPVGNTF
ncbi:unnamed protein product [Acanthoscelides obtectus]|uniref:Uncharacterized protein n=1 Tax=Acanthoscelides obtectus TaxID=200917 RepID=A0A9P0KDD3_ACAOB|nr:unnamed protein product [Acanthoscelides obtectus]CAK1653434.1 hypothetical protein AOBTE_LOCUS18229 [Acanthoscelides obtectus]